MPDLLEFFLSSPKKEKKVTVENANMYTLSGATRSSTGEYKCSLVNDDKMADTKNIEVNCEYPSPIACHHRIPCGNTAQLLTLIEGVI